MNMWVYPLVMTNMAIEMVDLSMNIGGSFHSYVTNYQRVTQKKHEWVFCAYLQTMFS